MKKKNKRFLIENYEEDLRRIKRWGKFKVVFYRTNLEIHTKRIIAILEELLPFIITIYPDLDIYKLFLLVWFHDAPEFFTGDVSTQTKLIMSDGQLKELSDKELIAIEILSDMYPVEILGYSIKELMLEAKEKKTLHAQLASYIDKTEGFCDALHHALAGHGAFIEPVWNYSLEVFGHIHTKYPLLKPLFDSGHDFFKKHIGCLNDYFGSGSIAPCLHTHETVARKTGFPHYEVWKKVTIKTFGINVLIVQKEFFHMKNA